ncbi:hypothetical protein [Nostoc sp. ChiSLP03a]|uniref:hypothetical protein n=1 Tax=Nostoc sp. ChiSLP03a TaxID=3075380 RepID=UPI002AD34C5F|nr:hypothetical protein [Nostoc sp. ChiSLP03a]MDZ8213527.1 hypothetical protein [Nostoc sp. ChiSLP03a]
MSTTMGCKARTSMEKQATVASLRGEDSVTFFYQRHLRSLLVTQLVEKTPSGC